MRRQDVDSVIRECEILSDQMKYHREEAITASKRRADLIAWLTEEAGMNYREVGRRLNLSAPRITQILNMRKWGAKTGGVAETISRS
jgi:hypothetical protein